jgi:transcriptional regulator
VVSGRKSFSNLTRKIEADPQRRARLDRERAFVDAVIGLTAVREARGATQQQVADAWEVSQANVSQIERTADIYLSTLRKYIGALGGQVEIRAVFPDEVITVLGEEPARERLRPRAARAGVRVTPATESAPDRP